MTAKHLIFEDGDGSIHFATPAKDSKFYNPDEQIWFNAVEARIRSEMPNIRSCVRLDDCPTKELPHLQYKKCWRNDGTGRIKVDMPLARAQRMAEIKTESKARRLSLFELAEDADLDGDTTLHRNIRGRMKQTKDVLDTAQGELDALTTPEELEAYQPEWPE